MVAVCVFCASGTELDPAHYALATELGAALAARGHTLVSGGGSVGSMGAVARAARAGGARTVGVIPQALVDLEVADDDADELVITADMRERKGEMDRRSDAFLVLPGGLGTLEELFEVWVARALGMHAKPVVVLDPAGVYAGLHAMVEQLVAERLVRSAARDVLVRATSVAEALDAVEQRPAPAESPPDAELLEVEL